jgi:FlaA1/EpsC-like NDP-sugar epimerase
LKSTDSDIATVATGRTTSLFATDLAQCEAAIRAAIEGKRVLAIGGAGSIGASTVSLLANYEPLALHVVDQNENGLAELVRQLRSRRDPLAVADFRSLPLDYGAASFRHFLASEPVYDVVLNFAALKHVRTEKDPFSTLQMFETNLLKQARLMSWLGKTGFSGRFFTVSTDKAANPSSMMGASKRAMEHVLFNSTPARQLAGTKTSARFANVAFSNGSLLQSFELRLARGEPLAAPSHTRRYFVSMEEAGEICTLASLCAPNHSIVLPRLNPEDHLIEMQEIAERILRRNGYEPVLYSDEIAACRNVEEERSRQRWPLLITQLDTAGEKPFEEFLAKGEVASDIGLEGLQATQYLPAPTEAIDEMLSELAMVVETDNAVLSKDYLKRLLAKVEPEFLTSHRESMLNLDQRV